MTGVSIQNSTFSGHLSQHYPSGSRYKTSSAIWAQNVNLKLNNTLIIDHFYVEWGAVYLKNSRFNFTKANVTGNMNAYNSTLNSTAAIKVEDC